MYYFNYLISNYIKEKMKYIQTYQYKMDAKKSTINILDRRIQYNDG
jgi:hypothetical protein